MRILTTLLLLLCSAGTTAKAISEPEAMITVRVTDEVGSIVTNAEVRAGFVESIKPGWGWGGGKENKWQGRTDANGLCVIVENCQGEAGLAAGKDGYYWSSGYKVCFTNIVGVAAKKWEPWNPEVDIVLKKVGNPIPMYAKWVREMTISEAGKTIGFDLQKGDWVAPYGRGESIDFLFRLDRQPEGEIMRYWGNQPRPHKLYNVELLLSFLKEDDGILSVLVPHHGGRSTLRLPAAAPERGYMTNLVKRIAQEEDKPPFSDIDDDQNYFFRMRTERDDKGNITSAQYGKIHGDFQFDHKGYLTFTYYLNPTPNDRNIEFNPKKNLFKKLSEREVVREP